MKRQLIDEAKRAFMQEHRDTHEESVDRLYFGALRRFRRKRPSLSPGLRELALGRAQGAVKSWIAQSLVPRAERVRLAPPRVSRLYARAL